MFNLYDNIQKLCTERGLTVSGMSLAVGMSKSVLSNLKNGRTDTISMRTAQKIAEYLDVPVDEVLHGGNAGDKTVTALSELRDCDRALLEVTKGMDEAAVYAMMEMIRKLKGEGNAD